MLLGIPSCVSSIFKRNVAIGVDISFRMQILRMLKELALLVTLLALFADARPQPYDDEVRRDSISYTQKVKGACSVSMHDPIYCLCIIMTTCTHAEGQ